MQLLQTVEEKNMFIPGLSLYNINNWFDWMARETRRVRLTCVQTLCDCGGIYEVACTEVADDVFIQVLDLQLDFLLLKEILSQFESMKLFSSSSKPQLSHGRNLFLNMNLEKSRVGRFWW